MDWIDMSIVEKAIKKMRDAQRSAPVPAPEQVFGTVVATGVHRVLDPGRAREPLPEEIVAIDQNALRNAGLLPPAHQERQIADQYRQIKRPLIANALASGPGKLQDRHANARIIMMASAMPGEGKTFTAINLAFSMAREKDVRVLLADVDVPKPHISRLFGIDGKPGLMDLLKDPKLDVESVILPTDVAGLSLLPAGRRSENSTELLASERMREIVNRICARDPRRIVLFDSPPLLLTTESKALKDVAGQIVMVVRAGTTSQQKVLDAISYLEGHSISLVLNQSMNTAPTGYYYYGYGDAGNSQPQAPG